MNPNKISAEITEENLKEIYEALKVIEKNLPFIEGLSRDDAKSMLNMSEKGRNFTRRAIEILKKHPDYFPKYLDVLEMEKDYVLFEKLSSFLETYNNLGAKVSNACALAGAEAYFASRSTYSFIKASPFAEDLGEELDAMGKVFLKKQKASENNNE